MESTFPFGLIGLIIVLISMDCIWQTFVQWHPWRFKMFKTIDCNINEIKLGLKYQHSWRWSWKMVFIFILPWESVWHISCLGYWKLGHARLVYYVSYELPQFLTVIFWNLSLFINFHFHNFLLPWSSKMFHLIFLALFIGLVFTDMI